MSDHEILTASAIMPAATVEVAHATVEWCHRIRRRAQAAPQDTQILMASETVQMVQGLRWQRLPEMERVGDFLLKHIDGIAAYRDHQVRFGVVESSNTTIKAVLRRARGIRDETMLLLKLKWVTAHPIRSARDLARFLSVQPLY